MYDQAVRVVLKTRRPSISLVQRQLRIGYNRAARLIEQMERAGLVSPMQTNGNRDVLVPAGQGERRDGAACGGARREPRVRAGCCGAGAWRVRSRSTSRGRTTARRDRRERPRRC